MGLQIEAIGLRVSNAPIAAAALLYAVAYHFQAESRNRKIMLLMPERVRLHNRCVSGNRVSSKVPHSLITAAKENLADDQHDANSNSVNHQLRW